MELPVFHAGYFRHTLTILQCICKSCSRVLLPYDDRVSMLKRIRGVKLDALGRAATFKKVVDTCKRNTLCPYCGFSNGKISAYIYCSIPSLLKQFFSLGVVKKLSGGVFKIIHEKHRAKNADEDASMQMMHMQEITKAYPDLKPLLQRQVVSFLLISNLVVV